MLDSSTNYKVILFSPRAANRNSFLNAFINHHDAYYYALTRSDETLDSFLRGLIQALGADNPGFGTQATQALEARKVKAHELAEALLADLKTLKPRPGLLILDSFDFLRITEDASAFLEKFVAALSGELRLIINGRSLSYEPWQSLVHSGQAVVLGEEQALDGGILTPEANAQQLHLEVYAFGK